MVKTGVRTLGLWLLLALLLSACQPSQAPAAVQATLRPGTNRRAGHTPVPAQPTAAQADIRPGTPPQAQTAPQGLRPDAPTYAVHGPFAVGYKSLVIGEGTEHPLEGSLWYPALNPTGRKEEITYAITQKDTTWSTDLPKVIYGHALLNAEIDDAQGPYPLVVWSPGFVPARHGTAACSSTTPPMASSFCHPNTSKVYIPQISHQTNGDQRPVEDIHRPSARHQTDARLCREAHGSRVESWLD